jgi:hypothetical protein
LASLHQQQCNRNSLSSLCQDQPKKKILLPKRIQQINSQVCKNLLIPELYINWQNVREKMALADQIQPDSSEEQNQEFKMLTFVLFLD